MRRLTRPEKAAKTFAVKFGTLVIRHKSMRGARRVSLENLNIGITTSFSVGYGHGAFVGARVLRRKNFEGMTLSFYLEGDGGRWIGGTCKVRLAFPSRTQLFFRATLTDNGELVVTRIPEPIPGVAL